MKQSSVVTVTDPSGCVLLLRRSLTDPWRPGFWNLPGGKQDPGETPRQTAARELAEESGICLDPAVLTFLGVTTSGIYRTSLFGIRLPKRPQVKSYDGESDAFLWTAPGRLPNPCLPQTRFALRSTRTYLQSLDT